MRKKNLFINFVFIVLHRMEYQLESFVKTFINDKNVYRYLKEQSGFHDEMSLHLDNIEKS